MIASPFRGIAECLVDAGLPRGTALRAWNGIVSQNRSGDESAETHQIGDGQKNADQPRRPESFARRNRHQPDADNTFPRSNGARKEIPYRAGELSVRSN